jgi:hypothetical protein
MKKNAKLLVLFLVFAVMLAMGSVALADSCIALYLNVPHEANDIGDNDYVWFEFTPSFSGYYEFTLTDLNFCYIELYDDSMNFLDSNGDVGPGVSLSAYLEGSTTYYLKAGTYLYGYPYTFEVVFLYDHICSFDGYRGFEAYHYSGLGHREFNYCSLGCGATQVIPNAYVPWVLCQECYPCNHNSFTDGPHYGPHTSSGHLVTYYCSVLGCGAFITDGYDMDEGCNECYPSLIDLDYFQMPLDGLYIIVTLEGGSRNVELFGEGLEMQAMGYIHYYSGDGGPEYDYMSFYSMMDTFWLTVSGTPGEWYSLIIETDSEIIDIQISF